jgi:hypothetical protein
VRSSTSSSELAVWRIAAVAVTIIAIYQLVAPRLVPGGGRGHDQWQENLIKAQRVAYGEVQPAAIVVGSSKLARVTFDGDVYNLALNGGGSLTGLDVILRAGVRPRIVVIEIGDSIVREPDEAFLGALFGTVNHALRRRIPILRDEYQPGVLVNYVAQTWASRHSGLQDDAVRPELLGQLLDAQRAAHARPADAAVMARVIGELRAAITALRAADIAVVLVEPPEHPDLWTSPMSTGIRELLRAAFTDVAWFPDPDLAGYQTTDGVHLDRASAERFGTAITTWLASYVARLSPRRTANQ